MANTELLIETLAHKVEVLKERLAQSQPHDSDHLTACKMECVLSLLPLILSRQDGAGVVSVDTNRLMHLEAERAKLKEEVKAAERRCKECPKCPQLEEQVKSLQEQVKTLQSEKEEAPALTFDQIAQATFGASEDCSQLRQQLAERQTQLDRVMTELAAAAAERRSLPERCVSEEHMQQMHAQYARDVAEVQQALETANASLEKCQAQLEIAVPSQQASASSAPVTQPPQPSATGPPRQTVSAPVTGSPPSTSSAQPPRQALSAPVTRPPQEDCSPLSPGERAERQIHDSIESSIDNMVNQMILQQQPQGMRFRSGNTDVWTPPPQLRIVGTILRYANWLTQVYRTRRPRLFESPTPKECGELLAQFQADMKKLVARLGCQRVNEVLQKAQVNDVSTYVTRDIPPALGTQEGGCLEALMRAQVTDGDVASLGANLVNALQGLFSDWLNSALKPLPDAPPANANIIHGIFCPLLPAVGDCVWPTDKNFVAWERAWNTNFTEPRA